MQPAHALKRYTDALRAIQDQAQATDELSYHHALLQLLRELDPTAEFIHEPKRVVMADPISSCSSTACPRATSRLKRSAWI